MTIEDILNDARSVVKKVVPDHVEITQVDFEGPTIVIYTKNMEVFAESNDLVRQIAQQLRRRIVVRPDPSLLATPEEAEKVIREVIPPEAQITGIYFETETGEVTIGPLPGDGHRPPRLDPQRGQEEDRVGPERRPDLGRQRLPVLERPGGHAPQHDRCGRHHPRAPGPLWSGASAVQVRIRRPDLHDRADPRSDVAPPARLHQGRDGRGPQVRV